MSSNEWKEYKLSEIMNIFGGGTPRTTVSEYWNGDIPWLSVKDFNTDDRTVYKTEKNITQLGLENSSTRLLDKGDLVISARGTVGAIAQLGKPMAFNQSCYGLRANELTTNDYLYYLLKYKIKSIRQNTHGSVFDTITRDTFEILKVNLPKNIKEQKAIAHILSTLDEKIEVNNQINKTIEAMAQAIFKHWFVDFEFPNENGEPYKSSGGEMVESELGMIPKGWEVSNLSRIAYITMGQSPKGTSYNEDGFGEVFYQGRTDFGDRFPIRRLYTTEPKRMAKLGDVLMSVRAPVGDINIAYEDCCIGRGLCSIRNKSGYSSYMYYLVLSLKDKLSVYNGEGTVFGSINKDALNNIVIVKPDNSIVDIFNKIASSLDQQYLCLVKENRNLVVIRDTLLPKLMSGEIRVPLDQEGEVS
ncbi:restriction endonuclease subunit S [Tepidibacillus decaturensis]|uniref:Type I restriction modification DNA specificity domain-containing protein n=1 Tax=Tepidibacillus decaturensis TaxID=1413211 RepID=A0A135L109_9BACI|nr:restriction endonuclease subunit S [Tepidibacillus decaturensis]KXG42686.1 hypothetical protein U473_00470 [Tepidibacillus decaturensis]